MEPGLACRNNRKSSSEKLVAIGLSVLAVLSPLYINRAQESELESEEGASHSSWLPLALLLVIIAVSWWYNSEWRLARLSSYGRPVAIGLGILAVLSPLFMDRKTAVEAEDAQPIPLVAWLPVLLLLLIFTIMGSIYFDRSFTRFDPYWIHRVGGSSGGIIVILVVLALVLKCKTSFI